MEIKPRRRRKSSSHMWRNRLETSRCRPSPSLALSVSSWALYGRNRHSSTTKGNRSTTPSRGDRSASRAKLAKVGRQSWRPPLGSRDANGEETRSASSGTVRGRGSFVEEFRERKRTSPQIRDLDRTNCTRSGRQIHAATGDGARRLAFSTVSSASAHTSHGYLPSLSGRLPSANSTGLSCRHTTDPPNAGIDDPTLRRMYSRPDREFLAI
jgi:hypothetical protein